MALSYAGYTGDGSNKNFAVPFQYIDKNHVSVTVNGASVPFSWLSASLIQCTTAPAPDTFVKVARTTPKSEALVDFEDASTLTATDLDTFSAQMLDIAQETFDALTDSMTLDQLNQFNALSRRITNVADPVDPQDVATKAWALTNAASNLSQAIAAKNAALAAQAAAESARDLSAGSATTAATKATEAAASAAAALASQIASASSASTATTQANISMTKADEAAASAAAAATSASNATTSKTGADTAATQANSSKNAAATSETNAATSATDAAASKVAAAASASAAQTSADAAAGSAAAAGSVAASTATTIANAAVAAKADKATTVSAGGIATGGGDLSANRTITVPKSTSAQALGGTDDSTAMTPARVKEVIDAGGGAATKADKSRTITGGGLVTGGGDLSADRVLTVTKASTAQAKAATDDTTVITPAKLADFAASRGLRATNWELDLRDLLDAYYGVANWTARTGIGTGTDIGPAIEAGITAAKALGWHRGIVKIPPGDWMMVNGPGGTNLMGWFIDGAGSQASKIVYNGTGIAFIFDASTSFSGGGIRGLSIFIEAGKGPGGAGQHFCGPILITGNAALCGGQMEFRDIYINSMDSVNTFWYQGIQVNGSIRPTEPRGSRVCTWTQVQIFCTNAWAFYGSMMIAHSFINCGTYVGYGAGSGRLAGMDWYMQDRCAYIGGIGNTVNGALIVSTDSAAVQWNGAVIRA